LTKENINWKCVDGWTSLEHRVIRWAADVTVAEVEFLLGLGATQADDLVPVICGLEPYYSLPSADVVECLIRHTTPRTQNKAMCCLLSVERPPSQQHWQTRLAKCLLRQPRVPVHYAKLPPELALYQARVVAARTAQYVILKRLAKVVPQREMRVMLAREIWRQLGK
jgi:hypothetical protein